MKIIIASDIHGELEYAKKLEKLIEEKSPDKIILLGDLLNNYDPLPVANILNRFAGIITCVRGNCDNSIVDQYINFNTKSNFEEMIIDGVKYFITHGHLLSYLENIIKDNYLIYGHTHIYNLDGQNINPGSVGRPRINKEHTCIYYENKMFLLINLDDFSVINTKYINC